MVTSKVIAIETLNDDAKLKMFFDIIAFAQRNIYKNELIVNITKTNNGATSPSNAVNPFPNVIPCQNNKNTLPTIDTYTFVLIQSIINIIAKYENIHTSKFILRIGIVNAKYAPAAANILVNIKVANVPIIDFCSFVLSSNFISL
ncbi:hypothetical protein RVBP17_1740 [Pseudomonas phage sp. 30-3]|nr:hypothetical protein RVBP16_2230 [Pseudomonas phage sp. 30-2]BDR26131.1 hypothetical protein RVBP17_1740 [Pseudomonas phage sp. 30-3]